MNLIGRALVVASPFLAVGWGYTIGSRAAGFLLTLLAIAVLVVVSRRIHKPGHRLY